MKGVMYIQLYVQTSCALRLLAYMADRTGVVPIHELSDATGFPKHCIASVAAKLKKKGYISAVVGPFGGYVLDKSPKDISLQEILTAFDDDLRLCDERLPIEAGNTMIHNLKKLFEKEENNFQQVMSSYRLTDLMKGEIDI